MSIKSAVQDLVNEIYRRDGEVRPSSLIEAAKPKDSPAHDAFEWNNSKAGAEYRLMQARYWIKRVKITIEGKEERLYHVTIAPESDDEAPNKSVAVEGYYKPASDIVMDESELESALNQLKSQVIVAKESFDYLKQKASESTRKNQMKINFPMAEDGFKQVQAALS